MQVVATWTGSSADALRQALRMTNESYAEHLGVAVRTVANWRKKSETVPQTAIQEILDAALDRAPDRAKAQFAVLVGQAQHGSQAVRREGPAGASLASAAVPEFGDDDYLVSVRTRIDTIVEADNLFGSARRGPRLPDRRWQGEQVRAAGSGHRPAR
jgi:transcriptional regulator with XRE-family HTH domain